MDKLTEFKETLIPVLSLTNLTNKDYLVVGSAAEFLAGIGISFGDIDLLVSKEIFKRLKDDEFVEIDREIDGKKFSTIRIGMVDIIEDNDNWLIHNPQYHHDFPTLNTVMLVEHRLWIGRKKDQLKAWQLIHHIESTDRMMAEGFKEILRLFKTELMKMR